MRRRGVRISGVQSRLRLFDPADQSQTGTTFSPSKDAFHPCFPASVDEYISEPCQVDREDPIHGRPVHSNSCPDACPCHANRFGHDAQCQVNNASANGNSAESDCASGAHHCNAEAHGDKLLIGTGVSIFNLPPEISDLILSYLSPPALDAARHTCKAWRTNILSNTWVLSSVLGVNKERSPSVGSPSGKCSHQDLLKKLDRDSALPSTSQHPDAWRTRFRTRNLDFTIPSPSSTQTIPALVAASRTGTQNGWLAFQLRDSAQDKANRPQGTLVIYRFDLAELPWYAGAVHNVEGQGALRITGVTEIRPLSAWVLQIEIGDATGFYSVTVRDAFSNSDTIYSLKSLESLEKVPGLSNDKFATQGLDRLPERPPIGDLYWNILAPFPPNGGLHHVCCSEGLRKHTEPRFLAEQTTTGNIYIVMGVAPLKKSSQYDSYSQSNLQSNDSGSSVHYYYTDIALLSCPRPNSVYINIAVAPAIIKDGSIRAAIVWQTTNLEKPISELYIYDIPEAYYEPCRAYSQNGSDSVSTTAEGISAGAIPGSCRLVQGKRITSLDQHMGGTHPSSPLYRFASPQEIALGGLQIPHTAENQEAHPRNFQYQKCFVWGPASSGGDECTQISMKVFDFSFADPQRLHSPNNYGVAVGWQHPERFHNITPDAGPCACALHDDGFRIALPDITTTTTTTTVAASEPAIITELHENARCKTASSSVQKTATLKESLSPLYETTPWSLFWWWWWWWWPWKAATQAAPDTKEDIGSVSRNDSFARREALERWQEWLRGHILGMKRDGLTDFQIAEAWNLRAWTRFGQVRKPEGWRDLGRE